jgi:hypothetical protein
MAKSVNAHDQVWQIIAAYNQHGMEGHADTPINLEKQRHLKLIEAQSRYKGATLWNLSKGDNIDDIGNCDENAYGPVGLLIKQLHDCGYELNNDLVATAPGEIPIDIWNIPWQHLRPAIMSIAIRKRNAEISANRTFCGDFKEIEIPIMKSVIHSLGNFEQKIHAHISSGAFWHELQLKSIQRSCGKCKHCGEDVTSTDHVLWECAVINKHRTIKTLSGIKHTHLHKAIRNNIPIAMTQRMHGCFWDEGPAKADIMHPLTEKLCGFQNGRTNTSIAEGHTMELKRLLQENLPNPTTNHTINARQSCQLLKQSGDDTIIISSVPGYGLFGSTEWPFGKGAARPPNPCSTKGKELQLRVKPTSIREGVNFLWCMEFAHWWCDDQGVISTLFEKLEGLSSIEGLVGIWVRDVFLQNSHKIHRMPFSYACVHAPILKATEFFGERVHDVGFFRTFIPITSMHTLGH